MRCGPVPPGLVGQLGMELLSFIDSCVMLTDRLRSGRLPVEAAYDNLPITSIDWMGALRPMRQG